MAAKKKIIWKDLFALSEELKAVQPKPKEQLEVTKNEAVEYLRDAIKTMHASGWNASEICQFIRNSKSPLQVGDFELRAIINGIINGKAKKKKTGGTSSASKVKNESSGAKKSASAKSETVENEGKEAESETELEEDAK